MHLIEIYSLFLGFHELSNTRRLQSFQFSHASHNRGPTTLSSFDAKITISLAGIGCWTMNKTTISAIFFYGHFCCRIIMRRWAALYQINGPPHTKDRKGKSPHPPDPCTYSAPNCDRFVGLAAYLLSRSGVV